MRAAKRPDPSHWVDETVPDVASILGAHSLDAAAFTAWLAPLLGDYRSAMHVQASVTSNSELAAELGDLVVGARAARDLVRNISGFAWAKVSDIAARDGKLDTLVGLKDRIMGDLTILEVLAGTARAPLTRKASKRGPKAKGPRDQLFAAVIRWLRNAGLEIDAARAVAEQVLIACRVPVPEDQRAQRRAAGKGS